MVCGVMSTIQCYILGQGDINSLTQKVDSIPLMVIGGILNSVLNSKIWQL